MINRSHNALLAANYRVTALANLENVRAAFSAAITGSNSYKVYSRAWNRNQNRPKPQRLLDAEALLLIINTINHGTRVATMTNDLESYLNNPSHFRYLGHFSTLRRKLLAAIKLQRQNPEFYNIDAHLEFHIEADNGDNYPQDHHDHQPPANNGRAADNQLLAAAELTINQLRQQIAQLQQPIPAPAAVNVPAAPAPAAAPNAAPAEIARLNAEIARLENELHAQSAACTQAQEDRANTQRQLDATAQALQQAETGLQQQQQVIQGLQRNLQEYQAALKVVSDKNDTQRDNIALLISHVKARHLVINEQESMIDSLNASAVAYKKDVKAKFENYKKGVGVIILKYSTLIAVLRNLIKSILPQFTAVKKRLNISSQLEKGKGKYFTLIEEYRDPTNNVNLPETLTSFYEDEKKLSEDIEVTSKAQTALLDKSDIKAALDSLPAIDEAQLLATANTDLPALTAIDMSALPLIVPRSAPASSAKLLFAVNTDDAAPQPPAAPAAPMPAAPGGMMPPPPPPPPPPAPTSSTAAILKKSPSASNKPKTDPEDTAVATTENLHGSLMQEAANGRKLLKPVAAKTASAAPAAQPVNSVTKMLAEMKQKKLKQVDQATVAAAKKAQSEPTEEERIKLALEKALGAMRMSIKPVSDGEEENNDFTDQPVNSHKK